MQKMNMIPKNPSTQQLNLLLDSKAHELIGNIMTQQLSSMKEWTEISHKSGVKIMKREIGQENILQRSVDFCVKGCPEKIAELMQSQEEWMKITHSVDKVMKIKQVNKDISISLIRCKKIIQSEQPRELLVASTVKRLGNDHIVVRTSVEIDEAPQVEEGSIRCDLEVSGCWIQKGEKNDEVRIRSVCIVDTMKPINSQICEKITEQMQEKIEKLKQWCQEHQ